MKILAKSMTLASLLVLGILGAAALYAHDNESRMQGGMMGQDSNGMMGMMGEGANGMMGMMDQMNRMMEHCNKMMDMMQDLHDSEAESEEDALTSQ